MITITRTAAGDITATLPAVGGDLEVLARTLAEAGLRVAIEPEHDAPTATVTTLTDRRRQARTKSSP